MPTPDNTLTLVIDNQNITGWQEIRVTRGLERFPSDFDISLTERYPTEPTKVDVQPGQTCAIYLGSDLVLTGYVDAYTATLTAREHTGACRAAAPARTSSIAA